MCLLTLFCDFFCYFKSVKLDRIESHVCDAVLQKGNVPKFEVEGHLDSTTCCVTEPFTGEVSALCAVYSVIVA